MTRLDTDKAPIPQGKRFLLVFIILSAITISAQSKLNIQIHGAENFSQDDYNRWINISSLNLKKESARDSIVVRISRNLKKNGYFFSLVKIDSLHFTKDSASATIYLNVAEGKRAILSSVVISAPDSSDSAAVYSKLSELIDAPFLPELFGAKLGLILNDYVERGFPFAQFKIYSVSFPDSDKVKVYLGLKLGVPTRIDKIIISGNNKTKDYVIERNIRIKLGEKYSESKIKRIPAILKKLDFFKSVAEPEFYFDSKKRGVLSIKVKEKSTNYFDGIIGYIPQTGEQKGYFTGSVKIDLRNLFGTGRAFGFKWEKTNEYSQYFEVGYLEPWIFGLPINISGDVNQKTQDTTYIKRNYSAKFNYLATENLSAGLVYSYGETIPSDDSSRFTVFHSTFSTSGLEFLFDNRDDYYVPTKGFYFSLGINFSRKKIIGPQKFIVTGQNVTNDYFKGEAAAGFYFSPISRNVIALTLHFNAIKGKNLEVSDLYRFGGTNSLRGFRYEQFLGDKVGWTNFEYRYLLSNNTYGFLFIDGGYYYNSLLKDKESANYEKITYGYGLGLNFATGLGNMKVSFALGEGNSFSEGKLHFGIVNRF